MSGTFPTSPGFSSTSLLSNQPTHTTIGDSGKRQSRVLGGHLWQAKITFPKMLRETLAPIQGFIAKQRGDSFQIQIQPYNNANGTLAGSPLLQGAASAGDTALIFDAVSLTGTLLAGDCIKFASHTKVYMITDDATAAGNAISVNITPPLIEAVADNNPVTYDGVEFTMAVDGNIRDFKTDAPALASFSVDLIESII